MCFTVPGKVIKMKKGENKEFIVDYGVEKRYATESAIEDLKIGDYVMMNNKIIVERLSKEEAEEFYGLL